MSNNWTTANIPDQTGKIMIVTEANNGLKQLWHVAAWTRRGLLKTNQDGIS